MEEETMQSTTTKKNHPIDASSTKATERIRPSEAEILTEFRKLDESGQQVMLLMVQFYAWANQNGIDCKDMRGDLENACTAAYQANDISILSDWISCKKAELKP